MSDADYKVEGFSIRSIGGREPTDAIPFGWVRVNIHLTRISIEVHPSIDLAVAVPYSDSDTVADIERSAVEETKKMLRTALAVIEATPLEELKTKRLI